MRAQIFRELFLFASASNGDCLECQVPSKLHAKVPKAEVTLTKVAGSSPGFERPMLAVPVGESPIGGGARYQRSYIRRRKGRPTRRKLGRKSPRWRGGMPAKIRQAPSDSTGAKAKRLSRKITCRPEADAGRKGSPR